ncbi:MAG: glucuronate isomerase [Acidobacteriota bacterium]
MSQSQHRIGTQTTGREVVVDIDEHFVDPSELHRVVEDVVATTPVIDMHTHLFAPQFGKLNLWGIDELLTYHYLIAELFRSSTVDPESFFVLDRSAQADLIWQRLFVENTPLSEATRGVIAVLTAFGLDPRRSDLNEAREFFASQTPDVHFENILRIANVSDVVMTNDPLDEAEMLEWETVGRFDRRFHAALRMDVILNDWDARHSLLVKAGFKVSRDLTGRTIPELRRFLEEAIERINPLYLAVSLPDTFAYPEDSSRSELIRDLILPVCRERALPFALMIGVKRQVNPALRLAGDGVGRASLAGVDRLCVENPDNRFLVTILSRENQHELCVSARKFSNLMPFGCWWFLNNPSIIEEITRERLELLGTSFIPQHSDARIFEQLIYKWRHSRGVITSALSEAYEQLASDGRPVTRFEIERDVRRMFADNFAGFTPLQRG